MNIKKGLQSLLDMRAVDNKGAEKWPAAELIFPAGSIKATNLVVEGKEVGSLEEWPTASWDGGEPPGKRFVEEALKSDWGIREMPIIAKFDGKEIAEAKNRAIAAAGGSLKEIEQEIHNRKMADQPDIMFKAGSDRQNEMEIERANGIIKALRIRSENKAESNRKLNLQLEEYKHNFKTDQAELQRLAGENEMLREQNGRGNEELEKENARLVDQITQQGEEYREGQKGSILELHETIKKETDRRTAAENDLQHVATDLQRANGVIDLILRGTRF